MLSRLCLLFILTNSVVAQAEFSPIDLGIGRIDLTQWQSTHAGLSQVDGMPVLIALEKTDDSANPPDIMARSTRLPLGPISEKGYRLVIRATENPGLRASFALEARNLFLDGGSRFALVSRDETSDFQFVATPQEADRILVSFRRDVGDTVETGEVLLEPLASTM